MNCHKIRIIFTRFFSLRETTVVNVPHVRVHQVRVNLQVPVHEDDAQVGGDEPPPGADLDVVALADVVDVDRDGGVGADPVSERGEEDKFKSKRGKN